MRVSLVLCLVLLCGACNKSANSTSTPEAPAPSADAPSSPGAATDAQVAATLNDLTQTVRRYAAEQRRTPKDLNELITAGYLSALPPAPEGKRFALNKNLQVYLANR